MGFPEETTFKELGEMLEANGHKVTKLAWPYFPQDMTKYSFSETIAHAKSVISGLGSGKLVLLGFSMGGIIATLLAKEYKAEKLALMVTPYQAGSDDDLAGKYKKWKEDGYRDITSSKYGDQRVPFSFIKDAQKYNALDYIQDVHCPVLFVVGEKDDKVPSPVTKKIFNKANEPKFWHRIAGMEHKYQYQQPEMLAKVNRIIVDFVD